MVTIDNEKQLKVKISSKLSDYRRRDKIIKSKFPKENISLHTISLNASFEMILSLTNKNCPECGKVMKFTNYRPYEHKQFSFDRIDECRIHDKQNLRIICFSCNSARKKTF